MKPAPSRYYAPKTFDEALAAPSARDWEVLEIPLNPNQLFELLQKA